MLIDNSNLLNLDNRQPVGYNPSATYAYNSEAAAVEVDPTGTGYGSGDGLEKCKIQIHDFFGNQVVGQIDSDGGGHGYKVAPTVEFAGGGGTGATAHAVLVGDKVDHIVVDDGGSGYTSTPTVTIVPADGDTGTGATATATVTSNAISAVIVNSAATTLTLDVGDLNRSKPLALKLTIISQLGVMMDGGAYGLLAAGTVDHWDTQWNAAEQEAAV